VAWPAPDRAVRLALAITTYERPEALAATLASVARQRESAEEILIADDGSGPSTRAVIEAFVAVARVPVRLVSQPHDGFRIARLRNLAIASSTCDYLVFSDGDMLLHPEFVADHRRLARPGFYTQGVRVLADAGLTGQLIAQPGRFPRPLDPGLGGLRRIYLLHSPVLARLATRIANGFISIKGCNQGFWRQDLLRANGFDEDMVGWGPEDKELCARLRHAAVRRQTLLFGGIACHLHHPAASRADLPANLARLESTRRAGKLRCEHGLDGHTRA
jgi:glycosyltransferase involved in cell wall biosynthesis